MRVNLVKDSSGKVVATYENAAPGAPSIKPALQQGFTTHEVEVPEDYKANITALYHKHSH